MSKRTLTNLSKKAFNTPLYITEDSLAPITNYLSDPERTLKLMQFEKENSIEDTTPLMRSDFDRDEDYRKYVLESKGINPETMVGTIDIKGTLVNRAGQTQACVELTSYERIKSQFQAQVNEGVKTVVMQIDSGGGEAYRLFGSAKAVRKIADDNDVKIIAYSDGATCSAAFGWASIADEIIANPNARVGSVGVVIQLYNDSKYLEKLGVERSFVYAGKNKIPFDKAGAFTDDFISSLQESVDKSYTQFTNFIATNRNMSVDDVVNTNAKVFDAEEAMKVGFVDKIMEIEEFEEYLNNSDNLTNVNRTPYLNFNTSETGKNMKTVEQLTTELDDANATIESKDKELNTLTESLTAEQDAKAELAAEIETLKQSLKDEQEAKESLSAEIDKMKADALTADRKAKLTEVLGSQNEQLDTLLTTTASLDDAAFSAIVSAMSTKIDKEDKEMNEIGQKGKEQKMDSDPFSDALKKSIQRNS